MGHRKLKPPGSSSGYDGSLALVVGACWPLGEVDVCQHPSDHHRQPCVHRAPGKTLQRKSEIWFERDGRWSRHAGDRDSAPPSGERIVLLAGSTSRAGIFASTFPAYATTISGLTQASLWPQTTQ